jgi:ribosomal protein L37AE/L43A
MSEPTPPRNPARPLTPLKTATSVRAPANDVEKMICERCGQTEMYRMHAVWRCPSCGFKTDCCGW